MSKLSSNYSIEEGLTYSKKYTRKTIFLAVVLAIFPFFPPYYVGFDPRVEGDIELFFAYMMIYCVCYVIYLGIRVEKPRKIKKAVGAKAVGLGCPIEIKQRGTQGANSYSTTVKVNKEMLEHLKQVRMDDYVTFEKEAIAMAEPFVEHFILEKSTSAKFVGKNIPDFNEARKMGDLSMVPKNENS